MNKNPSPDYAITLTNVTDGEVFCYSLPIIKGYVSAYAAGCHVEGERSISLRKLDSDDRNGNGNAENVTTWPVVNGNFKCLAGLNHGKNDFVLEFEDCRMNLSFEFKSKKISYHVLPVYIVCDGEDEDGEEGRFQAPENEDNTPESAIKRIALGARLIQSFTAEKLFESGMGRETFQLSGDMNLNFDCVLFRSRYTREEVYEMEPEEIWEKFGRELMSSPYGSDKRKFLAFLSCTKYLANGKEPETYEEMLAQMRGHVALGGGGLAIFGTGCLHTWPETVQEVLPRFQDETKVDKSKFMDDSCYRGTYGSCFSTTLGSVCHELGHAFDLGHSKTGIMGRGFDNINLVFTTGNQMRDANRNVTFRSEPQHSTVCLTRNLNITYCMSSPIKRPRGRPQSLSLSGPSRRPFSNRSPNAFGDADLKTPTPESAKSDPPRGNGERKKAVANCGKISTDDLTFWDKSCSVLLKYHRWFAPSETPDHLTSSIEFDSSRNTISSSSGIRVIELRNNDGFVLASWEFLNSYLPKQFVLSPQNLNTNSVKMVVAEDSLGNILKESL